MKIGAMIFATDQSMSIPRLAIELEQRGYESLWVPEKTHLPASRATPWPGGELPDWYKRTCDPFIVLAAAASVTQRLRLGTGVAMVPVRDAIITAKEIATLDMVCNGRFEFGIGYGWNAEEFASHNVDLAQAGAIAAEKIALMKALWTQDEGSYSGEFVAVEPSWSWPKPIQTPHPPIHMGCRYTPRAFADIAQFCDGWIPIEGFGDIIGHIPKLHAAFENANRAPASAQISVYSSAGQPESLAAYLEANIKRVVLTLPSTTESEVMRTLDRFTPLLESFGAEN